MRATIERHPMLWASAACGALAALTLLWSASPTYDPYSWLVWSREFSHASQVPLSTSAPTGWKPLTVFVAMPFAWVPSIQPAIWIWIVRTCCLMVLVFAFRLGRRASGTPGGLLAVVFCLATPEAFDVFHGGASEGIAALALLYGVEAHLDDRPGRALSGGLAASLARPEMLGITAPYGVWVVITRRIAAWKAAVGFAFTVFLWFVGDWLGDGGRPLALLERASRSMEGTAIQAHVHPGLEILARQQDQIGVALAAAAALSFAAALKWREGVEVSLGVVVLAVTLPLMLATELGYPGVPRYLMPVCLLGSVLAGAGAGRLAGLARGRLPRWASVMLMVAAIVAATVVGNGQRIRGQWDYYAERVRLDRSLPGAIEAAGGRGVVLACGRPMVRPGWLESALAFRIDTTLATAVWHPGKRLTAKRLPTVLFVTRERLARARAELLAGGMVMTRLASSGPWLVMRIHAPGTVPCSARDRSTTR